MKKLLATLVLLALGASAHAQMDNRDYDFSLATTNADSKAYVLRGEIEAVYVDMPSGKTATVAVATSENTVFSKSLTADGIYFPRAQVHNSSGTALSSVDSGSNTNATLGKFVAAGDVTVTVTPAAGTSGTNSYTVRVIFKK